MVVYDLEMSNLSVCCVMLANGRPEMVKRAIRSFKTQTLPERHLIIFDTGAEPLYAGAYYASLAADPKDLSISYVHHALDANAGAPIGTLRNMANDLVLKSWDCIAHWDSDDWSHPQRLIEQVTLLEVTGKECVGYNDMVFYRSPMIGSICGCSCHTSKADAWAADGCSRCDGTGIVVRDIGQVGTAWLWNNLDNRYALGTSLCYRRKAWERVPFLAVPNKSGATGEEYHFLKQLNTLAVSSVSAFHGEVEQRPRMIASIHGGNTQYYDPAAYVANQQGTSWQRAEQWDKACSELMRL
jgi:hypothetical protein